MSGGLCSSCGGPQDREGQRLCRSCHADYQREWKRQRTRAHRASVRSNSRKAKAVGRIPWEPCTVCGSRDSELHHPDHELPALTIWMCHRCHLLWHEHWREAVIRTLCEWLEVARALTVAGRRSVEDDTAPPSQEAA